jgi:hypothetical protein
MPSDDAAAPPVTPAIKSAVEAISFAGNAATASAAPPTANVSRLVKFILLS